MVLDFNICVYDSSCKFLPFWRHYQSVAFYFVVLYC